MTYSCPQCGKPLEKETECKSCGWIAKSRLTTLQIKNAVFEYLDELQDDSITAEEIVAILDLEESDLGAVLNAKKLWRTKTKRQFQQPQPQQNPNQNFQGVPDWALAPYKMQIENMKEQNKIIIEGLREQMRELREQNARMQQELRDELKKPHQTNDRWRGIEEALMKKVENDILHGKPTGEKKHWAEELLSGLIQSGQLNNIVGEVSGLLSDLRNKPVPESWQGQPQAQQQYYQPQPVQQVRQPIRRQPQANPQDAVPPADIKRRRVMPEGVEPATEVRVEPQRSARQEYAEQPQNQEPVYEYQEPYQPPPEQPEAVAPQQAMNGDEEAKQLAMEFLKEYPRTDKKMLKIAIQQVQKAVADSGYEVDFYQKLGGIHKIVLSVLDLKRVVNILQPIIEKNVAKEDVVTFLTRVDEKNTEQLIYLVKGGVDFWLEKAEPFTAIEDIAEIINYLERPEVRTWIEEVVVMLRPKLMEAHPEMFQG